MSDDKETIKRAADKAPPDVIPDGYIFFLDFLAKDTTPPPDEIRRKMRTGELQLFYVDFLSHSGEMLPIPFQEWASPYACEKAMEKGVWYNGPSKLFIKNEDIDVRSATQDGLTQDARRKGGSRPKQNAGLQEAINRIMNELVGNGTLPTNRAIWDWLCENAPSGGNYAFEPVISGCDLLYVDGGKLHFKDQVGNPYIITRRSLDPYITKARDTLRPTT